MKPKTSRFVEICLYSELKIRIKISLTAEGLVYWISSGSGKGSEWPALNQL